MAELLTDPGDATVLQAVRCARCAGRAVWRRTGVHAFDLATGERCLLSAYCCEDCGALAGVDLDDVPAGRTRARAHSPASRGFHVLDVLRDGLGD